MTREVEHNLPVQHTSQTGISRVASLRRVAGLCTFIGRCILDFVFPSQCCLCGASLSEDEVTVCGACWATIPVIGDQRCIRCGTPSDVQTDGCPSCAQWERSFQYVRILTPFDETIQQMIHLLKYKKKRSIGVRLGRMLAAVLRDDPQFDQVDLVLPIPLHKVRLKERGYNQSELVARALGKMLDRPVHANLLARTRNTSTQTKLNVDERRANVTGAFKVKDAERVAGRCIALVDDVLTTGATTDACTQALLDAGAQSVFVVAIARPFLGV